MRMVRDFCKMAKKNGPPFRKLTCKICKVYRWSEDFGGRSCKELTDGVSVCDFCELEKRLGESIAQLREENSLLKREVQLLKTERCRCSGEKAPDVQQPISSAKGLPQRAKKKKRKKKEEKVEIKEEKAEREEEKV